MKFGGTSVGSIDRIRNVAKLICEKKKNNNVIVTVSAMSGETDRLINLLKSLESHYDSREYDVIVSTGEQVSIALLAQALISMDVKAKSYTGWQAGIFTDNSYSKARIKKIETYRLKSDLSKGYVCVVAGFQGISEGVEDITTLGRGGSDTTAVAIATAVGAASCEIYTDVDGVYTGDPRKISNPHKLSTISFDEMLELAAVGAKVLHSRSVELAMKYNLPIVVLSSMENKPGTIVTDVDNRKMESIAGVAISDEVKIEIDCEKSKTFINNIVSALRDSSIDYDIFTLNNGSLSFYVKNSEKDRALNAVKKYIKESAIKSSDVLSKISVVGKILKKNINMFKQFVSILQNNNIEILDIYSSGIRFSFLLNSENGKDAANLLHNCAMSEYK
jgi:aspartate kinase